MKRRNLRKVMCLLLTLTMVFSLSIPSFGQEDTTKVIFEENFDYIVNPEMGATTWASKTSRNIDGSLVYTQESWINLEPNKGIYDFETFEELNNFDYWLSENNKYILQFNMDYPDSTRERDIPNWLYEEMLEESKNNYTNLLASARSAGNYAQTIEYTSILSILNNADQLYLDYLDDYDDKLNIPGVGTYYQYGMVTMEGIPMYNGGFSPDYSNSVLISYHSTLMEALGNRYNNSNHVFLVLMGSIGHWGEMHTTYLRDSNDFGTYPTKDIENLYLDEYVNHFDEVHVSTRQVREVGVENQFGLFHNAYGSDQQTYDWFIDYYTNGYNDYLTNEYYPAYPEAYLYAPIGGECIYTADDRYMTDQNIENTIKQIQDTHATYFDGYDGYDSPEVLENRIDLLATVGYRFGLSELSYPTNVNDNSTINLNSIVYNHGSAPIYSNYDLIIELRDHTGQVKASSTLVDDMNQLLPQTDYSLSSQLSLPELSTGSYDIYIGIESPDTKARDIQMTITHNNTDGFYLVGSVNVNGSHMSNDEKPIDPILTPIPSEQPNETPEPSPEPIPEIDLSEYRIAIYGRESHYIYPSTSEYKFNAVLHGDDNIDKELVWSVNGLSGVSINQDGLTSVNGHISQGQATITVYAKAYPELRQTLQLTYEYHPDFIDELLEDEVIDDVEEPIQEKDYSDYSIAIYGRESHYIYPQVGKYRFNAVLRGSDDSDDTLVWTVTGLDGVSVNQNGLLKTKGNIYEGSAILKVYLESNPNIYEIIELDFTRHPDYF